MTIFGVHHRELLAEYQTLLNFVINIALIESIYYNLRNTKLFEMHLNYYEYCTHYRQNSQFALIMLIFSIKQLAIK